MTDSSWVASGLNRQDLMAHLQVLCKRIGPRPPASAKEYEAGEYVIAALRELGLPAPAEQPFKSPNSIGWTAIPSMIFSVAAIPLGLLGLWGKLIGAALIILGIITMAQMLLAVPPIFQPLIARWNSRNLSVCLPPTGERKRRLFLVGHLDSQKQRFLSPVPWPQYQDMYMSGGMLLGLIALVTLLVGAALGWPGIPVWLWAVEAVLVLSLLAFIYDEIQPHIEGANDNATAVAILLGMAQALRDRPLRNTEVTLLFTGCEEVPCVGMENYLKVHDIPRKDSYWIDLEMVGTGGLCYVTRHGMSTYSHYRPHTEMVQLAEQTAHRHPELGVSGKPMLILEEVANLRRRNYQAICLAGYNKAGFLPNWHRLSDQLENIEPETLERTARFTWALAQAVDCLDAA